MKINEDNNDVDKDDDKDLISPDGIHYFCYSICYFITIKISLLGIFNEDALATMKKILAEGAMLESRCVLLF